MRNWLNRWGTTFIYWSFFITTITGILLMMRMRAGPTEKLHIWIGFLMVAAFGLHSARNWRAFVSYFKKTPIWGAAIFTLIISALLSYPVLFGHAAQTSGGEPHAMSAVSSIFANATLKELAPIADTNVVTIQARLQNADVMADDPDETIKQLAERTGQDANALLAIALTSGAAQP